MQAKDYGLLNPWLRTIRDVYRLHHAELDAITDIDQRHRRLVELNVEEQCLNVNQNGCRARKLYKKTNSLLFTVGYSI